jgi:hypothetical protein
VGDIPTQSTEEQEIVLRGLLVVAGVLCAFALLSVSTDTAGNRTSASTTHGNLIIQTNHLVKPSIKLVYWEPEKAQYWEPERLRHTCGEVALPS